MADTTNTNDQNQNQNTDQNQNQNQENNNQNQNTIDYDKIGKMINERNERTEKNILESYFQKLGLDESGIKEAIIDYKTKKESEKPDINKISSEINNYKTQLSTKDKEILDSKVHNKAILNAIDLGVNSKTIPYILKLADFSDVINEKNEINDEKIKESINKILEDVPEFKSSNLSDKNNKKKNPTIGVITNNNNSDGLSQLDKFRQAAGVKPKK